MTPIPMNLTPNTPYRHSCSLEVRAAAIVTKRNDDHAEEWGHRLETWLKKRGISTSFDAIDDNHDLVIVLGGDGTLLHIAEKAARHSIPVLGINLGNLGFLTELTEAETFSALEHFLSGQVTIENRLMLRARLQSGKQITEYRHALNDVVIAKNVLDRLLHLRTTSGDEYITTYKADGLILSSPTGSTAYNLSAGGPLVYPGLATITITPICPFMLSSRPIIVPADTTIRTQFEAATGAEKAQIIIDGQPFWEMKDNDSLEICSATQPLRLIVSQSRDYYAILRNKLNWAISVPGNRREKD